MAEQLGGSLTLLGPKGITVFGPRQNLPSGDIQDWTRTADASAFLVFGDRWFRTYRNRRWEPVVIPGLPKTGTVAVLAARNGDLWVGTFDDGIYRYSKGKIDHYREAKGFTSAQIFRIREGPDDAVWVATTKGLYLWDGRKFELNSSLGEKRIMQVDFDRNGAMWVNPYDGAMRRFQGGKWTIFGAAQGLRDLYGEKGNPSADCDPIIERIVLPASGHTGEKVFE